MKSAYRQKITLIVLVVYWIALLVLSHIKIPRLVYEADVSDKWLHFIAYLDLTFLVWFSIRPDDKVRWNRLMVWLLLFVVCAYGGLDELLQPYFGRSKDLGDFLFNAAGVLTALIIFTFFEFRQALLAVLAITVFGLTNLARADLSKLIPVSNAGFHLLAYGGITAAWIQVRRLYFPCKSFGRRVLLNCVVPVMFLIIVKTSSILLDRHFSPADLLFAVLGIIITTAGIEVCSKIRTASNRL